MRNGPLIQMKGEVMLADFQGVRHKATPVDKLNRRKVDSVETLIRLTKVMIRKHDDSIKAARPMKAEAMLCHSEHIQAHIRVSLWWTRETGTINTITVNNIDVKPEHRNKGVFTSFLEELENLADTHHRYICLMGAIEHPSSCKLLAHRRYRVSDHAPFDYYRTPLASVPGRMQLPPV